MQTKRVLQFYLDEMSTACLQGDWETYVAGVELPFHFTTQSSSRMIQDRSELRDGFDAYFDMLVSQRVTDYIRLVDEAKDVDGQHIRGVYTTHLLAGSQRIVTPFQSSILLRQHGNHWRACSIFNALANANWPVHVPKPADDLLLKGTDT